MVVWASTVALLAVCTEAAAHHSIAGVYDSAKPVTIEGVVHAFRFVSPHPWVEVDVAAVGPARGAVPQRWRLELDNRFELVGIGMTEDTLKPGDVVVVSGSTARDGTSALYVRKLDRPSDGLNYEQVGSTPRLRRGSTP
jgi:hypothetical protein